MQGCHFRHSCVRLRPSRRGACWRLIGLKSSSRNASIRAPRMKQQHTVTNTGHSPIKVQMEDGWHDLAPGESVTGVLYVVNNTPRRTLYRVEPFDPPASL